MAALVTYIRPQERIWLDPNRIGLLYAEMGGEQVQALLDRAMAELETMHRELAVLYELRDLVGFARNLRGLRRIADHLGLTTMALIAEDVGACLESGDTTALAATWSRLSRSAEQARLGNWRQG